MIEDLVSIIMPAYNCAEYIEETIQSVLTQTYSKWELLIVDDKSTDETKQIVHKISNKEQRIKYIELKQNSGVATARNAGIKSAVGEYIAFLDSDDLWQKDKLEKQICFMKKHQYAFTFTGYDLIDESGNKLNKYVAVPKQIDYSTLLYNTPIFTSTVMYDRRQLNHVRMPEIGNGEDVATWLQMLKKVPYAYGIQEYLVSYRNRKQSLSSGVVTKLKRRWRIYREVEKLSLLKAGRIYIKYLFWVVQKRKRVE